MTAIPIRGKATGNAGTVYNIAKRRGAQRLDFLLAYLTELYRFAPTYGINADVLVAQADLETGMFQSMYYVRDGNVAGFGAFDDGSNLGLQYSAAAAARGQVVHHCAYVGIPVAESDQAFDPRYRAVFTKKYDGTVITTADYGNGKWATDPKYAEKLVERYEAYFGTYEGAGTVAEAKRFILSAGHRNTNRGGASNEINWTYPSVVALKQAIEARGGKAWIVQEEDGDSDKSFYLNGGLQAAARKCVDLASKFGPFDAYISSHYNGINGVTYAGGFHALFPDSPTGGVDVKANNPLDVRLCKSIAKHVKATGTVGLLSWVDEAPGVMSERESHVGSQGDRLGEFYGTLGFRDKTARVILEAGYINNPNEKAYINSPNWVRNVYAEAIVDALEEVFGKFGSVKPDPKPVHDPVIALAKLDQYKGRSVDEIPMYVIDDNGKLWTPVMREVTFVEESGRYQTDDLKGAVGEKMKPGEGAYIMFQRDVAGKMVGYSNWSTRFDLSKTDKGVAQ